MKFLKSITEYFKEVNLPLPKHPDFYVGRHEENIQKIKPVLLPTKHELYSISIFKSGNELVKLNSSTAKRVLVRSPFKTIEWNLGNKKSMQGIMIIFSENFIKTNILWQNFLIDFPFFRHSNFFNEHLSTSLTDELHLHFNKIYECYYSDIPEKWNLIKAYLQIALLLMKQEYNNRIDTVTIANTNTNKLLADFEVLLIRTLENPPTETDFRQASFYATQLFVHTNHLNAVVKQVTGKTTSEIIQEHIIRKASTELRQTEIPVKEIADHFNFSATTHFIAFFKKHTGLTPKQYRESSFD